MTPVLMAVEDALTWQWVALLLGGGVLFVAWCWVLTRNGGGARVVFKDHQPMWRSETRYVPAEEPKGDAEDDQ